MYKRRVRSTGTSRRTDTKSYNKKTDRTKQIISQSTKNGSVRVTKSVSGGNSSTYVTRQNGGFWERRKIGSTTKLKTPPRIKHIKTKGYKHQSVKGSGAVLLILLLVLIILYILSTLGGTA